MLTARELGAEAVEIDLRNELSADDLSRTGVRAVRKMLDDLNLRVSAITFRAAPEVLSRVVRRDGDRPRR